MKLSIRNDRPPSSTDWVHFIFPFPGKCQAFRIPVGLDTIIEIPMHSPKLKRSTMILSECDRAWHNEVDVVLLPLLHLDHPPCSQVRIAHWSVLPAQRRLPSYRRVMPGGHPLVGSNPGEDSSSHRVHPIPTAMMASFTL